MSERMNEWMNETTTTLDLQADEAMYELEPILKRDGKLNGKGPPFNTTHPPPPQLYPRLHSTTLFQRRLTPPTSDRVHRVCTGYSINKKSHHRRLTVCYEP